MHSGTTSADFNHDFNRDFLHNRTPHLQLQNASGSGGTIARQGFVLDRSGGLPSADNVKAKFHYAIWFEAGRRPGAS